MNSVRVHKKTCNVFLILRIHSLILGEIFIFMSGLEIADGFISSWG